MEMNKETAAQMAEYIELTSDLIDKQAAEIVQLKQSAGESPTSEEKQAAEETPPVLNEEKIATTVDGLIEAGLAKEGERQKLAEHLKEPENCLDVIGKVAALRTKTAGAVPRMGKVAGTAEVSAGSKVRESDLEFERKFG